MPNFTENRSLVLECEEAKHRLAYRFIGIFYRFDFLFLILINILEKRKIEYMHS